MAQAGYTPIQLYYSSTTTNVPTAGNLANGELAINITDGKLFYKDNVGAVQIIGYKNVPLSTVTGTLGVSNGGTGATTLTANNVLLGNGTSAVQVVAPGTSGNVLTSNGTTWTSSTPAAGVSLSVANTWTATQTFNGTSSTFGTSLLDSNEVVNVVASAPSATTNFYVQSGSVQYYTSNAANNWTLNIAFSSGTSMNTALATGQSVTFTLVTTQGSTAYYNNAVTIDGTSVTPKWIGGAPTAGNASGLDVYRGAIIKTASATYTVLMSLTQYK